MADFNPDDFLADSEESTQAVEATQFSPESFISDTESPSAETGTQAQSTSSPILDLASKGLDKINDAGQAILNAPKAAGEFMEAASVSALEQVGGRAIIPAMNAAVTSVVEGTKFNENYRFWQNQWDRQRAQQREDQPVANVAGSILPHVIGGGLVAKAVTKAGVKAYTASKAGSISQHLYNNGKYILANAIGDGLVGSGIKASQIGAGSAKGGAPDIIESGLENMVGSAAFSGVLKAGGYGVKVMDDHAMGRFVKDTVRDMGTTVSKGFNDYFQAMKGRGLEDEVILSDTRTIMKEIELDKVDVASNPALVQKNLADLKTAEVKKLNVLYKDLDNAMIDPATGVPFQVNTKELYDRVAGRISNIYDDFNLPIKDETKQDILNQLRNQLIDPRTGEFSNKSIKDYWSVRRAFNDGTLISGVDNGNVNKAIGGELTNYLNELTDDAVKYIDKSNKSMSEYSNLIKPKRLQYGEAVTSLGEAEDAIISAKKNIPVFERQLQSAKVELDELNFRRSNMQAASTSEIDSINKEITLVQKSIEDAQTRLSDAVKSEEANRQTVQNLSAYAKEYDAARSSKSASSMILEGAELGDAGAAFRIDEFNNTVKNLKSANNRFAMINEFGDNVVNKAAAPVTTDGFIMSTIKDTLKNPTRLITTSLAAGKDAAKLLVLGKASLSAAANTLETISNQTRDEVIFQATKKYAKTFDTLSKLQGDTHVARITSNLLRSLNDDSISLEEQTSAMSFTASEVELYLNPLPRSVQGVKERLSDVITYTNRVAPQLSARLEEAAGNEDDNTLRETIDAISKVPEAAKYFQAGTGIDSILFGTDREQAAISIQNDIKYNSYQRAQIANEVRQTGKMPDMSVLQRQPKTYAPRDKNKVR